MHNIAVTLESLSTFFQIFYFWRKVLFSHLIIVLCDNIELLKYLFPKAYLLLTLKNIEISGFGFINGLNSESQFYLLLSFSSSSATAVQTERAIQN